jgi:hypothetical protein
MVTKLENNIIQADVQKRLFELEIEFLENSEKGYHAEMDGVSIIQKGNFDGKYIEIQTSRTRTYNMRKLTVHGHQNLIKFLLSNRINILALFSEIREKEYSQAKEILEIL